MVDDYCTGPVKRLSGCVILANQTDSSYLTSMASVTSTLCWDGHVGNTFDVEEKGRCSLGSSDRIMIIRTIISWEDDVDMIHSEKAY